MILLYLDPRVRLTTGYLDPRGRLTILTLVGDWKIDGQIDGSAMEANFKKSMLLSRPRGSRSIAHEGQDQSPTRVKMSVAHEGQDRENHQFSKGGRYLDPRVRLARFADAKHA